MQGMIMMMIIITVTGTVKRWTSYGHCRVRVLIDDVMAMMTIVFRADQYVQVGINNAGATVTSDRLNHQYVAAYTLQGTTITVINTITMLTVFV